MNPLVLAMKRKVKVHSDEKTSLSHLPPPFQLKL
jgi:hypothetical protein